MKRGKAFSRRVRGAAIAQTAIVTSMLGLGAAALAIDSGLMFHAHAELQTVADAAALAAAAELGSGPEAEDDARAMAAAYAEKNKVTHEGLTIDENNDVVFGHATYDANTGKYTFNAAEEPYDAVQVTARRTATAADGPVQLLFGSVFGKNTTDISASAVAMLVPRDIAVVIDLSASMNDDSELRHYDDFASETEGTLDGMQINLRDVWCAFDGPAPSYPYEPAAPDESEYAEDTGPSVGSMTEWGSQIVVDAYDPTTDSGLLYLPRGSDWTGNTAVEDRLESLDYTDWEKWAILTNETQGYLTTELTDSKGFSSRVIKKNISSTRDKITIYLTSDSSSSTPALSHLTVSLPSSARSTAQSTAQSQGGFACSVVAPDPTTGYSGIKFDETDLGEDGVSETEWFSFEVPTSSSVGSINVVCKAGSGYAYKTQNFESVDKDNNTRYRYRVACVLGLANWLSGMPGGDAGGDGDGKFDSSSEVDYIDYPTYRSGSWTWEGYVDYVRSTSTAMYATDSDFRQRFGLKTFINYLLESHPNYSRTNIIWQTPAQPLQAVKDAVQAMMNKIDSLESLDHVSLEVFAQTGHHEIDLTGDFQTVADRLYEMQAGHYDNVTNIGGGLDEGIDELESARARAAAAKVIVLMTDGKPNVNQYDEYVGNNDEEAVDWCYDRATYAAENNMRVYTVAVGADADRTITQTIAEIAYGEEFYAAGSPDEYTGELEAIFETLGGKRPVQLIK